MDLDKTPTGQDKTPKPKDETLKVDEPSLGQKEPSPEEEPKTLTIAEAEKLSQLARMDAGRAQKDAEVERDAAKAESEAKEQKVADLIEEIEKLRTDIDALASGDIAKFNVVKKERELLIAQNALKEQKRAAEAKWKTDAERVKKAEDHEREIAINEIAANYEGGDAGKLVTLCETFGANTKEEITKVADTLWAKKASESPPPETKPLKPFSGRTSGGGGFTPDKKDPDATLSEGFRIAKK